MASAGRHQRRSGQSKGALSGATMPTTPTGSCSASVTARPAADARGPRTCRPCRHRRNSALDRRLDLCRGAASAVAPVSVGERAANSSARPREVFGEDSRAPGCGCRRSPPARPCRRARPRPRRGCPLRLPRPTSPASLPLAVSARRRVIAVGARTCLPPMNSFAVRSMAGAFGSLDRVRRGCGCRLDDRAERHALRKVFDTCPRARLRGRSRFAVAAEAAGGVEHVGAVDPDDAGLDLRRDVEREVDVLAPHDGGEAVAGVVGELDRFARRCGRSSAPAPGRRPPPAR